MTSFAALIFSLVIDFRSLYGLRLVSETSVAFYSPWFSPCVAIATSFLTFKGVRAKVITRQNYLDVLLCHTVPCTNPSKRMQYKLVAVLNTHLWFLLLRFFAFVLFG